MREHYTDGRRWSHISNAWILVEGWNDKEEIASLKAQLAYALDRVCPHCASKDDSTYVVECSGCVARHRAQLAAEDARPVELEAYDAGLLNDFGGGNVEWWQDYIRAELGRAHDFYQSQLGSAA